MEELIHKIGSNWELALSFGIACISFLTAIVQSRKRKKEQTKAKTSEEKSVVLDDIRSEVFALVGVAEELFGAIPKSGVSKLKYVLNKINELCEVAGIEFDNRYWTDFVNYIVNRTNNVKNEKAVEQEKIDIIEKIKEEVPFFVNQADELFKAIPDSFEYKIEYILKNISIACDKYEVNVYFEFDWKTFVLNLYEKEGTLNA